MLMTYIILYVLYITSQWTMTSGRKIPIWQNTPSRKQIQYMKSENLKTWNYEYLNLFLNITKYHLASILIFFFFYRKLLFSQHSSMLSLYPRTSYFTLVLCYRALAQQNFKTERGPEKLSDLLEVTEQVLAESNKTRLIPSPMLFLSQCTNPQLFLNIL